MRTITLRNLPPELEQGVEAKARELGLSLSKTVIRLLHERLAAPSPLGGVRYHDLDHLAGSWTSEEAAEFERGLKDQRRIDPELWD